MINIEDFNLLEKTFDFWSNLNENEKTLISENASIAKYKSGENISNGENNCVGVFVVKSGALRTYMLSDEGREVTLYRMREGDICVMSAACLVRSITFDVIIDAEEDTEMLLVSSIIFAQIIKSNIIVENFVYKAALDRFSDVMWTMEQILFMSVDKRLAIFLLDEIALTNSSIINLTHEQIAKYMGSAREVVSRMLKYFETEGYVKLHRGNIEIIDKVSLRKLI